MRPPSLLRRPGVLLLVVLAAAACREPDGPLDVPGVGVLVVESDPPGARISIDGRSTGRFTPDTIEGMGGVRDVVVQLDTAGASYRFSRQVVVSGPSPFVLRGPLTARCQGRASECAGSFRLAHTVGSLRFGTSALGALFPASDQASGLHWPAAGANRYLAIGLPMFAAMLGNQPVSLGIYDTEFLAGRPAPEVRPLAGGYVVAQTAWILPPPQLLPLGVVRGLEVSERVVASAEHDGLLLVELVFRNITHEPLYRIVDPFVPVAGTTFFDAFVGLALDPDIGGADDDWLSYDEALAAVFAYDADFAESGFTTAPNAPALLGLRLLQAPAGARTILNGWANTEQTAYDWRAGDSSQFAGYGMLSGTGSFTPDHPGDLVGHLPVSAGDVRITVTVGPLQLAPGDSAKVVLGLALAAPAAGTYTSGQAVAPGSPDQPTRPLHAVAANLRARLLATEALLPLLAR